MARCSGIWRRNKSAALWGTPAAAANPSGKAAGDPQRPRRSASLDLDDHLDFNSIIERKPRHLYSRACVLSHRRAEDIHHQIGNPFITLGWSPESSAELTIARTFTSFLRHDTPGYPGLSRSMTCSLWRCSIGRSHISAICAWCPPAIAKRLSRVSSGVSSASASAT